jgi:hypothetical protein
MYYAEVFFAVLTAAGFAGLIGCIVAWMML